MLVGLGQKIILSFFFLIFLKIIVWVSPLVVTKRKLEEKNEKKTVKDAISIRL